jgi:N-acetylglucosamine-6-phosphate deacetylase
VSDTYLLGPARLAVGDGSIATGRLAIERGRIARILPPDGPSDIGLPAGAIVAPGLIDVHTNGADEFLFNRDQGNAVEVAARAYARMGATGFVASIMTAPWESMMHAASEVSEAANQLEESPDRIGARCLGIQFEGPFLNPKFRRVHRAEWLLPATIERANEMIEACRGALVMVTMAPEAEGVDNVARMLFDQGIVCSAGHTSAHYRDGMLAIGLGFRTLTHAYNGMPPLDHRVAARRLHSRIAHDRAAHLRRLPRFAADGRSHVPDAARPARADHRQHAARRQRLPHRGRRRACGGRDDCGQRAAHR